MSDVGQAVTTIAAVAVGAGLTYLFGALTRRQQEAREKDTRWYDARLQAHIELFRATTNISELLDQPHKPSEEEFYRAVTSLTWRSVLFALSPPLSPGTRRTLSITLLHPYFMSGTKGIAPTRPCGLTVFMPFKT